MGKYEKFSLLVESIGAIAIVISLIFVGMQIDQANKVARSDSYHNINNDFNHVMEIAFTNEKLFKVWIKTKGRQSSDLLSMEEEERMGFIWRSIYRIYDSAYLAYRYKTLGETEWSRMERKLCVNYSEMGHRIWWTYVQFSVSKVFKDYVQNNCK